MSETQVERRFSDELGFTDFADGIGPVYATADQMIEQIRREREQSEEYWAENERLLKVVDAAEALIQAQQKPGERVPVTYYADFGRRIQTLRDALREPEDA